MREMLGINKLRGICATNAFSFSSKLGRASCCCSHTCVFSLVLFQEFKIIRAEATILTYSTELTFYFNSFENYRKPKSVGSRQLRWLKLSISKFNIEYVNLVASSLIILLFAASEWCRGKQWRLPRPHQNKGESWPPNRILPPRMIWRRRRGLWFYSLTISCAEIRWKIRGPVGPYRDFYTTSCNLPVDNA